MDIDLTPNLHLTRPSKGVAQLTLSQPARRNALNAAMWAGIPFLLRDLKAEAESEPLKALIVTGDGDHFASGADITEFETLYATPEDAAETSAAIAAALDTIAEFPVPTVAMIRGACVGGGCGVALACDLRFADSTAKFAITPAKLGLVYPFADLRRLVDTVGLSAAKDMMFSARLVGAEEAFDLGLVDVLAAPEDLENEVMDYLDAIVGLSGGSLRATKAMFGALEAGQRVDDATTKALFADAFGSEDFREGYAAFLKKRKPDFG